MLENQQPVKKSSRAMSHIKVIETGIYHSRKNQRATATLSKQHPSQVQQNLKQIAATILQNRDRLRIYYENDDLTPRFLVNSFYSSLEDRRTAFDVISIAHGLNANSNSGINTQTSNFTSSLSFSSTYTLDEIVSARPHENCYSMKESSKPSDVVDDYEDVPSLFQLPKSASRDFESLSDRVTIILKETDTFFLFELPQLTVDATTTEGQAIAEENERYERTLATSGRKTVNVETQTLQVYTKTRSTYIQRQQRKNCGTIVNNWVMFDTLQNEIRDVEKLDEEECFKFPKPKIFEVCREPEGQLEAIGSKESYEEISRIILRILASKSYAAAQKRFIGLLRQDPCDFNLELVYGLDLLWQHTHNELRFRRISVFTWNPVNHTLLAAGYTSPLKSRKNKVVAPGVVVIWSAKNPTEPDRFYEFTSCVSNMDWSRTRPNLLAIGFYDGIVRVIDISKKQLTIIRQSDRKSVPSYEPHWQVMWWPATSASFETEGLGEQLYTSNQDGRIYSFTSDEHFIGRQLLRLWRLEGKLPGVQVPDQCVKQEVPITQSTGVLLMRYHPTHRGIYFVGTEEGYIHRCSTSHHRGHFDTFRAHSGPIYSLEFSPFCDKILLTCGADWTSRIWADGILEPLLAFSTSMACVTCVSWSPRNSTIFVSAVNNEICIWDIRRKSYRPASVTCVPQNSIIERVEFTRNGEQIVAADNDGNIYIYGTVGMPLPPFDQYYTLINSVEKALLVKPEILKKFRKLGFISTDEY